MRNTKCLRQIAAATAVLALHIAAVRILLGTYGYFQVFRERPQEHVLYLLNLPNPAATRLLPSATPQLYIFGSLLPPLSAPVIRGFPVPPLITAPSDRAIMLPAPEADSSLRGLARALGCTLDKYETLPPGQKSRCAEQLALAGIGTPIVRTMDEQRLRIVWDREYARKQAPFLVPCIGPGGGLDFITLARCLAGIAINGFDPDKLPTYAEYPEDAK